jgi:hypothetical protein
MTQSKELDRVDRALTKLRVLNTLLSAHDQRAMWTENREAFDAIEWVTQEMEALTGRSSVR